MSTSDLSGSAGPTTSAAAQSGREVLDRLREVLGDKVSEALPTADAAAIVEQAWGALAGALREGPTDESGALLEALRQLRTLDRHLLEQKIEDRAEVSRRLGDTLSQLEQASCSVAEVVQLAPQLICELGFERAIISQVHDGLWLPEAVFIVNDPAWAAEITRVGREQPQPLVPGLFETEIVRRREALVVTGVQQQEARVHRGIADASQSRAYVAAPVLSRGRVVGFVHADRFGQGREVDEHDREVLVAFAKGLRLALGRATLAERLQATHDQLNGITAALAAPGVGNEQPLSIGRRPDGAAAPPAPAWGGSSLPPGLPKDLTRRELEVLELLAAGKTNAMIAKELVIAETTVKQHVKHVLRKVHAANRSEATAMWFQAAARQT